jgi:hypothetical protein
MDRAKYVIVEGSAIVFSAAIQHKAMVGYNKKCDGAGFVTFKISKDSYGDDVITAHCYGKSISLDIESRPEQDSEIVTRQIINSFFS